MAHRNSLSAFVFKPRHVLLVEDQEAMRMAVAELLETDDRLSVWGSAGSAEDALELLEDGLPDIALVDLDLPGMNGLELTAEIRRLNPGLPVLVLSSHPVAGYEEAALDAGATTYLPKERAAAELLDMIHAVLDLPPSQRHRPRRAPAPAARRVMSAQPRPRLVAQDARQRAS
jgi:DNA-binding NarL/FixJ family response regulator